MIEAKTPQEFFEKTLPSRFKSEKAKGIDIVALAKIIGPHGGNWTVVIKDQKIDTREGAHGTPTLTIEMAETDFLDVVNARMSAEKAFFMGKIQFKGNISLALKLKDIGFL